MLWIFSGITFTVTRTSPVGDAKSCPVPPNLP